MGDNFQSGSVIEPIDNLFAVVDLTGGAGNNTMVVGSPTNTINVGGTSYTVVPFAGSATLNSATNTASGVEFYIVNIANNNAAHVAVADTGGTSGEKILMVNGSEQADNLTLDASGAGGFRVGTITDSVVSNEFINFTGIERLVLDTLGGNDNVLVNDTAVPTVVNFGNGNDNVIVGTVPLIPDTGNRTLDFPNGVPVVNTKAMTNGNSDDLFIMGGAGNDTFEVDHNSAMLYLHGGAGISLFILNTFLVLRNNPSNPSQITNLNTIFGGSGNNRYEYLQNAPVDIVGGSGYNTIVIVGTPIGDTFVIGNNYIAGAGRMVNFSNIQSIEVDSAGGDDTIYILATDPNLTTTINGGPGDNTIHIGGDPPPLVFNPPPYTYTPPAIEVPQPDKVVTTPASQTFSDLSVDVNLVQYVLDQVAGYNNNQIIQMLLGPFLAAFGSTIPGYQLLGTSFGSVTGQNFYNFFNPFQFAPVVELTVSSLTINYQTQTLVPQAPLFIQPPSITVAQPPYVFQTPENLDAAEIQGRVIVDGGQNEQVSGNTVIFHDEDGTAGAGFLRLDTFPQLTSIGEVTPPGATSPVPLFGQDGNVTDTYLTLGGFGLGIPTTGIPAYPGIQLATGLTQPDYDGVELVAGDVQHLELLLPNGQNDIDVQSVPSDLNLTIDPGSGTNTIDLQASGASTTIDGGVGTNNIVVGQGGELNQILDALTVNGNAHITEQTVPQTGNQVGTSLLSNLPLVFVNTETSPGSFQGTTSGETLSFAPAQGNNLATITLNGGSWSVDGFLAGDRIAVSGTGTANDGIYFVQQITGTNNSVLNLVKGSALVTQPGVSNVSVVAEVHLEPIVQAINPNDPGGPLQIWTTVLDSSGSIITDQVQEWGSQEYGIQATDGSGNPLYYDTEGNQTTSATLTGIPVINQVAQGTPGAMPVYYNESENQVFGATNPDGTSRLPVYIADFTSGVPLYVDAHGNLTATPTSMPFLIPVRRSVAVPWTTLTDTQVTETGTNTLTLDDSADPNATTGSLDVTQIPVNQLVDGQPVYDGGAASPVQEFYYGGEPVIDPFTGQPMDYSGGEPVLNLLTGQPEYGPTGQRLVHKKGDPMLHVAGDPVVHTNGDTVVYLGGELARDANGNLVPTAPAMTGSPTPDLFAPAQGGNPATITRGAGSWILDGFAAGDEVLVSGTPGGKDDGVYAISAIDSSGTILLGHDLCQRRPASNAAGVTVQNLLTDGGGETAIHNPHDPVLDLITAQGQPVAVGSPYTPPAFFAPFGTTLNLNTLAGFTYRLKAGDLVSLVEYKGTAIVDLPAADYTVNTAANTITLINPAANLAGVSEIALSIATQAYHAAGDPRYYFGSEPLQVGQPVVDSSGNLVLGANGQVELYTAATIGDNATQYFDFNGGVSNTETFTLNTAPNGYTDVTVAGTDLSPSEYSVSGTQVTVTPSFMPAQGSQVVITYRLSVLDHQTGEPVYVLSPNGVWVQATYSGGQPAYYLGTEPVLYYGGEPVDYTDTQPLQQAENIHDVTVSGGMPGTVDFTGVSDLTIKGGSGNNTFTIVQTQLGPFGTAGTDSTPVTLDTGNGNDQVAIRSIESPVTVLRPAAGRTRSTSAAWRAFGPTRSPAPSSSRISTGSSGISRPCSPSWAVREPIRSTSTTRATVWASSACSPRPTSPAWGWPAGSPTSRSPR